MYLKLSYVIFIYVCCLFVCCIGFITSKVVTVLDMLDRHHFDHVDSSNNLDVLYSGTFSLVTSKNGCEVSKQQMLESFLVLFLLVCDFVNDLYFNICHLNLYCHRQSDEHHCSKSSIVPMSLG